MAEIRRFPVLRHLRADTVSHVLQYRRARSMRSGVGLSFWFNPMTDSIAEIPVDDRELHLLLHARSNDFQDVTIQGMVTYRASSPEELARRLDFSIDLGVGSWRSEPLEQLGSMLSQMAQEHALAYAIARPIQALLAEGVMPIRDVIEKALQTAPALAQMGVEIVTARISAIKPSAELEKALEAPTRERIKQDADEAAYARRATAVQNERAIAENEMQNRIELARREHALFAQQGENARRQAHDAADAAKIAAEAKAERISVIEGARTLLERERLDFLRTIDPAQLVALAAREFAVKVSAIEHFNVTPDLLALLKDGLGGHALPG